MGANKPGDDNNKRAAATEDDLSHLDLTSMDANKASEEGKGFVGVTEENLGRVAPGCFVRFGCSEISCWVETGRVEGDTISGRLHHELSNSPCLIQHNYSEVASISRDQITALGCDRYCWC